MKYVIGIVIINILITAGLLLIDHLYLQERAVHGRMILLAAIISIVASTVSLLPLLLLVSAGNPAILIHSLFNAVGIRLALTLILGVIFLYFFIDPSLVLCFAFWNVAYYFLMLAFDTAASIQIFKRQFPSHTTLIKSDEVHVSAI
jgi:hypothetical protein